MDIAALQGIVVVARMGSISAAARALGQPKQSISRRISAFETRLGVRLLERSTRSVRLTAEGQALCQRAEYLLAELDELQYFLAGYAQEPEGPLRISAPELLGQELLGPVIARYCRLYPKVELQIDLANRAVDLVEEGFDAAIRVGAVSDTSLIARSIARSRSILVTSPNYAGEHGLPAVPADLSDHFAVLTPARMGPNGWLLRRGTERIACSARALCQVSSIKLALEIAAGGTGITMVPAFIAMDKIRRGELVRVLPDWHGGVNQISIVHPSRRLVPPRLRVFIEMLVDEFSNRSLTEP